MTEAEKMILEDAIEQAIDTERTNIVLRKHVLVLTIMVVVLVGYIFLR